jgi:hypothetical protein
MRRRFYDTTYLGYDTICFAGWVRLRYEKWLWRTRGGFSLKTALHRNVDESLPGMVCVFLFVGCGSSALYFLFYRKKKVTKKVPPFV